MESALNPADMPVHMDQVYSADGSRDPAAILVNKGSRRPFCDIYSAILYSSVYPST
jgi:hypothetical protein